MLPFFASNGAIIHGKSDRDSYNISVEEPCVVTVTVDTDTLDGDDWAVDHPPRWLHTDEEGERVDRLARDAVREYWESCKSGKEQGS